MMNLLRGVCLAATALVATAASANTTMTFNLDADVGSRCGVYRTAGTTVLVPFGDLAAVPSTTFVTVNAGDVTYRCNSGAGFSRTISSVNGGKLVRVGSAGGGAENTINYEMDHGGSAGIQFNWLTLTAVNRVDNFNSSSPFLAGRTGAVQFRVNGVQGPAGDNGAPGTTVFAGDYTDTVTITITSN